MLIYEKNGKLNLDFINGSIPAETPDVSMYKTGNDVHCFVGTNDIGEDDTRTIKSIKVKTVPQSDENMDVPFYDGETLVDSSLQGMVITVTYDDGTKEDFGYEYASFGDNIPIPVNTTSQPIEQTFTVYYKDDNEDVHTDISATFKMNVNPIILDGIEINTGDMKTEYSPGEKLNTEGLWVTPLFKFDCYAEQFGLEDVTEYCTFDPGDGTVLTESTSVNVSYTYNNSDGTTGEATGSFNVTVNP